MLPRVARFQAEPWMILVLIPREVVVVDSWFLMVFV
jgi:hypothetical protein